MEKHKDRIRSLCHDILNLMEDGIFISDKEGTTLYINKAYEKLTGLSGKEVCGKAVSELQSQGVFDVFLNPKIVKTKAPASLVQKLGQKNNIVHLQGFPVFDDEGEVCLVVTFVRDVTVMTSLRETIAEQRKTIERYHGRITDILGTQPSTEGIFASPVMKELVKMLMDIAQTDATVLLLGETGVGKDVLARMIHQRSKRDGEMFMKVDCSSIAETLIESEFFGYVKGAFSGANTQGRAGYFEMASGGTIFLDEIGELPLPMQSKLLRVLQDQEIIRLGSSRIIPVDVRIIAATNRDLKTEIKEGKFRQDLFYRLNVAKAVVPPLRERLEDIPLLAKHFLDLHCTKYKKSMSFSDEMLGAFTRYSWPGNIRELYNLVLQLVVTKPEGKLTTRDLPSHITTPEENHTADLNSLLSHVDIKKPLNEIIAEIEEHIISRGIEEHGSIHNAAKVFQVNRSTLFRKLNRKTNKS